MSVEHYMPPVIETLPPYIFTILCCSAISYGLTVCLWKNGQWLTIQVPMPPIVQCDSRESRLEYIESELKELQPFAKSLVFGKTNWAYFIRGDHGRRTIAYRKRPLYRIKYQPCVPKVHQDELTYLRPAQGNTIEVIWRGQQLDMQLGWEDATSALLERQMRG
ncbi:hypothetical protein F5887DRAFT_959448 [Amanita rubescens]|nr:hypothetical protein F5887DRAFT_959448 [Amanita rubescens]